MATYYGYAERNAEDQINWNAIGKSMTDTLLAEQKRRDDLKAQIDKDSVEFGETLSNYPEGNHQGMVDSSINYASDIQSYQLLQLRLLKAGKIKLRDYIRNRENLVQGTKQYYGIMEKYNAKFDEFMKLKDEGKTGARQAYLLAEVEGFGNLANTRPYINPTTGNISIGKQMLKDPSKPYDAVSNPYTSQMGSKPADFKTTQQLEFSLLGPQMSYDSSVAIDETVSKYAADYQQLEKSGSSSTKITDITENPNFEASLRNYYNSYFESNPNNAADFLTDFITQRDVNDVAVPISYVDDPSKLLADPTKPYNKETNPYVGLMMKPDPAQPGGGRMIADMDSESGKEMFEFGYKKFKETVEAQLKKEIEYERGFQPRPQKPSDGPTKTQSVKIGDMLSKLRSGSPNDIKAAEEYFVNTTKGKANAVIKLERNNDGVSITYANGSTQDISFKDQDGNIKSNVQWIESSASAIGGTDDLRAARSGGSKFNNSDFTNLKEGQIIEHGIKLAESVDDQAMDYYNQEKNKMVVGGNISASRILKFGSKFGVPVSKGKSKDGTEDFYFVGSGREPISIQITQGGKKLPITKYIYDLQNAVIGAIDEDDIVTGYKKASPSGTAELD